MGNGKTRKRVTADDERRAARIRELFLVPRPRYTFADAHRLTGVPAEVLREAIEGILEPGESVLRRDLLALVVPNVWGTDEIEDALGWDATRALPPLRRTRSVTIPLPEYALRYIEAGLGRLHPFPHAAPAPTITRWIESVIADDIATADDERAAAGRLGADWLRALRWPTIETSGCR